MTESKGGMAHDMDQFSQLVQENVELIRKIERMQREIDKPCPRCEQALPWIEVL